MAKNLILGGMTLRLSGADPKFYRVVPQVVNAKLVQIYVRFYDGL